MKKLLLFTGMFLFCSGAFAQQIPTPQSPPVLRIKSNSIAVHKPHQVIKKIAGAGNETTSSTNSSALIRGSHPRTKPAHRNGGTTNTSGGPIPETIIGTTVYDLQTNGTVSNRIVNVNGKISATWTMALTGNTADGWPSRGTGYNYSSDDGSTWDAQPTARVETFRTGFQNIAYSGATGSKETILSHDGATGLPVTSRGTQGSGPWSSANLSPTTIDDLWPKFTAGGANGHSFHAIWRRGLTAGSLTAGPLWYSRSTDDGATWSTPGELPNYIAGVDLLTGIGGDSYSIDARGDVIAIVTGDFNQDLVLLKSTDNGQTWTKRIVDQFPIPLYDPATMNTDLDGDGITDTVMSGASDQNVVIDNNNVAHVFYGKTRCFEDAGATALSYFFTQDLYYWREDWADNAPRYLAGPPDVNHDGVISVPTGCNNDPAENPMGYYGTGLIAYIEMPSASVDASNNIYLSYQAVDELSDTTIYYQMFMHPYILKSCDGGDHWTNPDSAYDVLLATQPVDGESYDGAYAALAKNTDSYIHVTYQRDFAPGTTLSGVTNFPCEYGNNNEGSNEYVYVGVPVADVPCGTWAPVGIPAINNPSFSIASNYPNPFHGKTSVNINLKKASDVTVEVSDLLGRVLSVQKYQNFGAGTHTLTIDATTFATGVYTYKISTGNDVVTKKMIVQ